MKQPRPISIAAALAIACVSFLFLVRTLSDNESIGSQPEAFEIVDQYPHDDTAFTQGLEFINGNLVESTGLVGKSSIRLVEPKTGSIISSVSVGEGLFAEGVTAISNSLFQLTWLEGRLLRYELVDKKIIPTETELTYQGEGWGLCFDGQNLVRSDGSSKLSFHSSEDFSKVREVTVTEGNTEVDQLNELECHDGKVFANIFESPLIKLIDLSDGTVLNTMDLSRLRPEETMSDRGAVLNGIALNPETGHLWVTGKRWPTMFELDISDLNGLN